MGSSSSSSDDADTSWCSAPSPPPPSHATKKARILCLHGWRTNAEILSFQMGAMQANINTATFVFLDAPYPARGDPVPGIAMFYPDRPYYEWFYRTEDGTGYEGNLRLPFLSCLLSQNSFYHILQHTSSNFQDMVTPIHTNYTDIHTNVSYLCLPLGLEESIQRLVDYMEKVTTMQSILLIQLFYHQHHLSV